MKSCLCTKISIGVVLLLALGGWALLACDTGESKNATAEEKTAEETRTTPVAPTTEDPMAPPADPLKGEEEKATPFVVPSDAGSITGTVSFQGDAPKAEELTGVKNDKYCSTKHTEPLFSEACLVKDGKLQNAVVYIKPKKGDAIQGKKFDAPKEAVVLDQSGCTFRPHIVAMMAGQTITVRNSDETAHNVHFNSLNSQDNKSQTSKGAEDNWTFSTSEVGGSVKCDIHSWMGARFCVFKHPFFAVTGTDGAFEIKNVPAGKYTLIAWHETLGEQTSEVEVKPSAGTAVEFAFGKK